MKKTTLACSIALTTLPPILGLGQASASALEEIIVSAQKRDQSITEVPAAVAAYSGDHLEDSKVDDLRDLQLLSPNLSIRTELSPSQSSFFIRGLGTSGSGNLEQSVGVYIDGVYRGRPGSALQDLMDIQRVEILRGPQSSIFGRNNSAGAIAIHTEKPSQEFSAKADMTYGSEGLKQIRGSFGGAITDSVAYRFNIAHREADTYIENLRGDNDKLVDRDSFRGQLFFDLTESTSLRVIGDYSDSFDRCCVGPTIFLADTDAAGPLGTGTIASTSKGAFNANGTPGTLYDPFDRKISTNQAFGQDAEGAGISTELTHDFESDMTLTVIASRRYFDTESLALFETSGSIIQGFSDRSQAIDENSFEARLAGESSGGINWLTGVYYFDQAIDETTTVNNFSGTIFTSDSEYTAESYAAFGQIDYMFNEQWGLTTGLRYSTEEKEAGIISTGPVAFPGAQGNGTLENDDDEWMGDIALRYEMGDIGSIYARYGRGYKSGGMTVRPFGVPLEQMTFSPETVDAFEIGSKLILLEQRLFLNSAIFYQEASDLQVQAWNGFSYVTRNAAEVETLGLELEYTFALSDQWTLNGGATYLDSEYGSFENAPAPIGSTLPQQNLTGETPLQSPEWTITGGIEHAKALANTGWEIKTRLDYRYTSEQTTDLANNDLYANDSVFELSAGIKFAQIEGGLAVQLWGKNITDEDIINTGVNTPRTSSAYVFVNAPATYGITLSYQY